MRALRRWACEPSLQLLLLLGVCALRPAAADNWANILVENKSNGHLRLVGQIESGDWLDSDTGHRIEPVILSPGEWHMFRARSPTITGASSGNIFVYKMVGGWQLAAVIRFSSPFYAFLHNKCYVEDLRGFKAKAEVSTFPTDGPLGRVTVTLHEISHY